MRQTEPHHQLHVTTAKILMRAFVAFTRATDVPPIAEVVAADLLLLKLLEVAMAALSWPWRSVRGSCEARGPLAAAQTSESCLGRSMLTSRNLPATA